MGGGLFKDSSASNNAKRFTAATQSGDNEELPPPDTKPAEESQRRVLDRMLEVSMRDVQFYMRVYPAPSAGCSMAPTDRIAVNAQDILVSFARPGEPPSKVLGAFKSAVKPREIGVPFVSVSLGGYGFNTGDVAGVAPSVSFEHRIDVRFIPMRLFVDAELIDFILECRSFIVNADDDRPASKDVFSETKSEGLNEQTPNVLHAISPEDMSVVGSASTAAGMFFQFISVAAIELTIDFKPSTVSFAALQGGDYLQLLNLFPPDNLSLTLAPIALGGMSSEGGLILDKVVSIWTNHIIQHQLHRVLSGTAPFRPLAAIGGGLANLMLIPVREFKRFQVPSDQVKRANAGGAPENSTSNNTTTSHVARDVAVGTKSLVQVVAREALQLGR